MPGYYGIYKLNTAFIISISRNIQIQLTNRYILFYMLSNKVLDDAINPDRKKQCALNYLQSDVSIETHTSNIFFYHM